MLSRSIDSFKQVVGKGQPVFFDRGIPELLGYCRLIKASVPNDLYEAIQTFHYNQKVFIAPPWKEIYQQDNERKQTWQEAIDTYERIADAYLEIGYQLIEIPKNPVSKRVDFIFDHIHEHF